MKYKNLLLSVCLSWTCLIESKIIETKHIEDVIPYIQEECWFLVDLNNTLFEGKQALGHANWFYDEIQQRQAKGISKDEAFKEFYPLWVKTQEICPVKSVEEKSISILQALQQRKIVVMGFTHRQPPVAVATIRQVASLGLDFAKTAPHTDFDAVPASGGATCYQKGILFAGDYNRKGEVLLNFLAMSGQHPKKIIFIDDKYKNVEELEKVLANQNIDYVGIYYTAIDHQPAIYSRDLAQFQLKYLHTILSNEAAECLIKHGVE